MRPLRLVFLFALLGSLSMFVGRVNGQNQDDDSSKPFRITFHVTSVRSDELSDCDPAECVSKVFTVEGYAEGQDAGTRTVYVLTCDEYVRLKPTLHFAGICSKVHANNNYDARVFRDSISFWPEGKYTSPPMRVLYKIVSEKEVNEPLH